MKIKLSILSIFFSTVLHAQNNVRTNQYMINPELINSSNVFRFTTDNSFRSTILSSDNQLNGFLNFYNFNNGSGFSGQLIKENNVKILSLGLISSNFNLKKIYNIKKTLNKKQAVTFSSLLNTKFDNNKISFNQSISLSKDFFFTPKREVEKTIWDKTLFQFSAIDIWNKNRLFFASFEYQLFEKRTYYSNLKSLSLVSNNFYGQQILFFDIGLKTIFARSRLELQYLYRFNIGHIVSTQFKMNRVFLGFNYQYLNYENSISFSISRKLSWCSFILPEKIEHSGIKHH